MTTGFEYPQTKKAKKHPTSIEIAWAAGFLEGEGCFHPRGIKAPQVQKEPLIRLLKLFGGALDFKERRQRSGPGWLWRAHGSRARGVMLTIYVLMSPRRQQQIRIALRGKHANLS